MKQLGHDEQAIVLSLDPAMQSVALNHRALCLERGVPFHFLSGYRPTGYQAILHDINSDPDAVKFLLKHPEMKASTVVTAGKSKHELMFAYDATSGNQMQRLIFGSIAEGLGLEWGGRYAVPDWNHIEAPFLFAELESYRKVRAWAL